MSVRLRLQRFGRKKAPFYHIVAADSRSPRDGKYIEKLGTYNPLTVPATIELNRDRALYWVQVGAESTDTVSAILRFKGVMLLHHLLRGVKKGAMTEEQAMAKFQTWLDAKENKISNRIEATKEKKKATAAAVSGVAKPKPVVVVEAPAPVVEEAPVVVEAAPAVVEVVAEPVVEVAAPVVVEEAPVVEAVAETVVVEEAPAAPVAEVVTETIVVVEEGSDPEFDKLDDVEEVQA